VRKEQLRWQYRGAELGGVVQFLNTTLLAERYGISGETATLSNIAFSRIINN